MEKTNGPINIVIVALNEKFCKAVATSLSTRLDMFTVDCRDMIAYDLIDPNNVLDMCGVEYFKKRERGVVKNCAGFYNTVISINYELLSEYQDFFENSIVFYIKLPKEKIDQGPNRVDYVYRDEVLTKISKGNTIKPNNKSILETTNKIINKLGEIYENC